MMRTSSSVPAPSLFPFLAVLLGTMGVLVLQLFVSVRLAANRTEEEQAAAAAEREAACRELEAGISLEQIRLDAWAEMRPGLADQLQAARMRQSSLLRQIDEIRERRRLADAGARNPDAPEPDTERELVSLQAEIGTVARQIAERQKELDRLAAMPQTPVYSVVPTSGSGAAARRPIYVECRGDAVVLQPLEIVLGPADFLETGMPGNPLDAALGEIRDYWLATDTAGDGGRPYPLLIVRPDGATAYAAARRSMHGWTDEFGYELIDGSVPLAFGAPDEALRRRVEDAIERSRQLLAVYHRQMEQRRRLAAAQEPVRPVIAGLRASPGGGGFVSTDGSRLRGAAQGLNGGETAAAEGIHGEGGFRSARNESMSGTAPASGTAGDSGETGTGGSADRVASAGQGGGSSMESAPASTELQDAGQNPPHNLAANPRTPGQARRMACLADRRGQDWALQKSSHQRTGYRRPVTAWCDQNQLRIEPGAASWLPTETIDWADLNAATADQVANAVRRVIAAWGTPPEGGYWRPELRVKTFPGAETRLAELRQLLDGSGIEFAEAAQ